MAGSDLSISRVGFPTADIDVGILVKLAEDCCQVRHFSRFLRSGWPNCWHCETPLYANGGQIFILRTLIWGTRGVKGKAHCAISVVPTLAQRTRKNGVPRRWLCT